MKVLLTLLILFVALPLTELALLLYAARHLGLWHTLAMVIVTGFIGATLAKSQGLQAMHRIRTELQAGRLPAAEMIEGALILFAGAVLLTPGFITDIFGFLLLLPATRRLVRSLAMAWFARRLRHGAWQVHRQSGSWHGQWASGKTAPDDPEVIDVEARSPDP